MRSLKITILAVAALTVLGGLVSGCNRGTPPPKEPAVKPQRYDKKD